MKKEWTQPTLEVLDVTATAHGQGGGTRDYLVWEEREGILVEEFRS